MGPSLPYDAYGQRRLMAAVLEDAVQTLLGARRKPARPKWIRRDLEWLTSTERRDPFAFETICETLGIDPSRIRRKILSTTPPAVASRGSLASRRCSGSS